MNNNKKDLKLMNSYATINIMECVKYYFLSYELYDYDRILSSSEEQQQHRHH